MKSYCNVTYSAYPVTTTRIRHCSILEFGRRAYTQAVAPGISALTFRDFVPRLELLTLFKDLLGI